MSAQRNRTDRHRRALTGVVLGSLILAPTVARAAPVSWDGACGTGLWFSCCNVGPAFDTNWTKGTDTTCTLALFPQPSDDVDVGANAVVLDCCGSSIVNSFLSNGSFTIAGGQELRVATIATYNGPLSITHGGPGGGTHAVNGGLSISGDGMTLYPSATVNLNSDAVWTGSNSINLDADTTLNIQPGRLFDAQSDSIFSGQNVTSGFRMVNVLGTFRKSGGTGATATANAGAQFNNLGQVDIQTGTFRQLSDGAHAGTFNLANGTTMEVFNGLNICQAGTAFTGGGTVHLDSFATIRVPLGATVTMPRFSQSGATRDGDGTLNVSVQHDWSGGALSGPGKTVLQAGATMNITSQFQKILNGDHTLDIFGSATWTGAGTIHVGGGGTIHIQPGGVLEAQSDTNVDGNGPPGTKRVLNEGIFRKAFSNGSTRIVIGAQFINNGLADIQSGTLELYANESQAGVFKTVFGSAVAVFGAETLNSGTSIIGTGDFVANGGTITIPTGVTVPATNVTLTNLGGILGAGTLSISNRLSQIGQSYMNGPGVTQILPTGTLAMSTATSFAIDLARVINAGGTTTWDDASQIFMQGNSTFNNLAGATFDARGNGFFSIQNGSAFNNAGTFRRTTAAGTCAVYGPFTTTGRVETAAGTLEFNGQFSQASGESLLSGGTLSCAPGQTLTFAGGTIRGSGDISVNLLDNVGAVMSPGASAGTINIAANPSGWYSQGPGATLQIELGGLSPGSQYDVLNVAGNALLDGKLVVKTINAFPPALGQTFTILNCAARSGAFSTLSVVGFPPGLTVSVIYNPTSVVLNVVPGIPADGDMNCDGKTNGADIQPFVTALLNPALYAIRYAPCDARHGDFNGTGAVDAADIAPFQYLLLN